MVGHDPDGAEESDDRPKFLVLNGWVTTPMGAEGITIDGSLN